MRLTIINQFYRPDVAPTGHLAASLAEHRAESGDRVTVVTSKGGYVTPMRQLHVQRTRDSAQHVNPSVVRIWTPQLGKSSLAGRLLDYLFFYVSAIWRVITLPAQDVVVSLTTPPYIAWAAVLHKFIHRRTKVVLWNMDCYPDVAERSGLIRQGGVLSRLLRAVNRALFRQIDHLVCLDHAMLNLLSSQYSSPVKNGTTWPPATVIPNWEDLALFPPRANSNAQALASMNDDSAFVILYLGNAGVGHAFDTMLDAAEVMKTGGDRIRFRLIGGGSRWCSIAREIERRSLTNVDLSGYVPKQQTPAVMAAADAALITLRDEALGVMSPSKLHSNLAMGLPILYIGPAESNVDEAVTRFGCGASFRNGDVDGLVGFIRRLVANPERHQHMRRAARQGFEQAYCDQSTLPQFDALFDRLQQCNHQYEPNQSMATPGVLPPCQYSNT